ncbi:MAG TPA: glycosyltransferase, partial [Solirubrobacteraceae bacterium]|nr:glycosyltransferase [Solirubrobacteraceae bacterium]
SNHGSRFRAMFAQYMPPAKPTMQLDEWPFVYNPRLGMAPRRSPVDAGRPLKLLHLTVQSKYEPQTDMRRAFARIGPTIALPWSDRHGEVLTAAERLKPDVVFAQIQCDAWSDEQLASLRRAVGPDCLLAHWTGDVRTSAASHVDRWMVRYADYFNLMLSDNTTYASKLQLEDCIANGSGYLSCGADGSVNRYVEREERGGVVFIGSNYPGLPYDRVGVFEEVERMLPGLLTIWGAGWASRPSMPTLAGALHPGDAAVVMQEAAITISTSLFHDLGRYTSDRLKRALCAGAVVAVRAFDDMEGLGLKHGENCLVWRDPGELVALLRDWTRPQCASERKKIRERAAALGAERHTWDSTVEEFLAIARDWRARRGLL